MLQHDEVHSDTLLDEDGEESSEPEDTRHRRALLGAWSPPEGITPLGTVSGAQLNGGLFGLALSLDVDELDKMAKNAEGGAERDSGVHVDEMMETPKVMQA